MNIASAMVRRMGDKYYFLSAFFIARNVLTRQYRDSFLGIIWTVLQPMVQVLIYAFVFGKIMRFPVQNYVLFITSSFLVWQFIFQIMLTSTLSIIGNAENIKRSQIPVTIFPVAEVLKQCYTFGVSFVVMYGLACLTVTDFHWTALLVPVYMLPVVVAAFPVAIALGLATPYLRDLGDIINLGMSVMFWLTPVIYPITIVPEHMRIWFEFNPFYILIRPVSALVYEARLPTMYEMGTQLGLIVLIYILGIAVYKACRRNFVYYL